MDDLPGRPRTATPENRPQSAHRATRTTKRSGSLEANKRDLPYQSLIKVWLAEKAWKEDGTMANALRRPSKR
jgi:hypothetical protein